MLKRAIFLAVLLGAVPLAARAQSCPQADAVLGVTKSKTQLKTSYDKFADSTSLETGGQIYKFKTTEAVLKVSFVVKHAGAAPSPVRTQIHIIGGMWWDHGVPTPTPAIFDDSVSMTVLADSAKFVLHGGTHSAPKPQSLVTSWEDLWIDLPLDQLGQLARASSGGMRMVDKGVTFDMDLKGNLSVAAAAAFRTAACAPTAASIAAGR